MQRHVETTWHSLGTCSMAPREGNSIVKNGVLDERLNVHGVKGLKVCDLSICPDNVGCNTFSVCFPLSFDTLWYEFVYLTNQSLSFLDGSLDRREVCSSDCRGSGILWSCPGYEGAYLPRTWRSTESGTSVRGLMQMHAL